MDATNPTPIADARPSDTEPSDDQLDALTALCHRRGDLLEYKALLLTPSVVENPPLALHVLIANRPYCPSGLDHQKTLHKQVTAILMAELKACNKAIKDEMKRSEELPLEPGEGTEAKPAA